MGLIATACPSRAIVATVNTARTARARSAFLLGAVGSAEPEALDRVSPCLQSVTSSPLIVRSKAKAVRRPVEVEKLTDQPVERTGPAAATELIRLTRAPAEATAQRPIARRLGLPK